ncbi:odorant receptor 4-like isoform X2 [Frieseomelitta varia]|uniref:odorant receptor 4-like isoform X2 n=1 Tax=Frieseomelitta varia TaxID=561572 RepID=UPI001CB68441|nr:odorant receptor 4-like isoform X2 [Frieseomelitta varia]
MQTSETDMKSSRLIDYNYEEYVNLSIQWSRWLLKPMGLWPYSSPISRFKRYIHRLINIVCYSLISFLFIPSSLFVVFEMEDTYGKLKQSGPLIFCATGFVKYYSLINHKADISECVERIKWDWKNTTNDSDREIMITNANFGRKLVIVSMFFMYSGFVFYSIVIPFSMGRVTAEDANITFIPLIFPFTSYFADARYSPLNEIVFSVQVLGVYLIHSLAPAACSLAAVLAVHTCGQMQVLMNCLKHLIDGRSDMSERLDGRVADIVRQHVRVLKYVPVCRFTTAFSFTRCYFVPEEFNSFRASLPTTMTTCITIMGDFRFLTLTKKTLQQISFAEFLGCTLDICLLGYYIIMELKSNDVTNAVTYMIFLVSFTFNIFIFCYIGEIVAEECRRVGEISYMIEWYQLQGNKKLCCVLIIAMSNSSTKLTAGNIVELSISTFSSVMRTSAAFFNVLRKLT